MSSSLAAIRARSDASRAPLYHPRHFMASRKCPIAAKHGGTALPYQIGWRCQLDVKLRTVDTAAPSGGASHSGWGCNVRPRPHARSQFSAMICRANSLSSASAACASAAHSATRSTTSPMPAACQGSRSSLLLPRLYPSTGGFAYAGATSGRLCHRDVLTLNSDGLA
jgi:hypothetical protein